MADKNKNGKKVKTCFVVTPIGKKDSEIRRHVDGLIKSVIKPALGDEYDVKAAHDYFDSMSITKQVYEKLYESDLVIVNLTGLNPNVMYELGIRFCFGKPVILIAKEGENLPFDITEYRTYFYKDDFLGISELKETLEHAIKTIKYDGKTESPIHDALRQTELFKQLKGEEKSDATTNEALAMILDKINAMSNNIKRESIEVSNNLSQSDREYKRLLLEFFHHKTERIRTQIPLITTQEEKNECISEINELRFRINDDINLLTAEEILECNRIMDWLESMIMQK